MSGFYTESELRERLSVSTFVFWQSRPVDEKALTDLVNHDIHRIELLESPEQCNFADWDSVKYLAADCRAAGVTVGAFHAQFIDFDHLDTETQKMRRVDQCKRQIDNLARLGGKIWGCHAHCADPTLLECLEQLAHYVASVPVVIAIENFSRPQMGVEDRVAFLDQIDHPQVKLILDIGHVRDAADNNPMTRPGGPRAVLDCCGRRLCHLHLHGFVAQTDHYPPFAPGDAIQYRELFRGLYELDYPGFFNFEPRGAAAGHRDVLASIQAAPRRIAELCRG